MRFSDNNTENPDAYYEPNSFDGPVENKALEEPNLSIEGDVARYDRRLHNDDFNQVRALFNLFDEAERTRLYSNLAAAMQGVPQAIQEKQIALFTQVHEAYGAGVRQALKL